MSSGLGGRRALPAGTAVLLAAGCAPLMEFRDGDDQQRLRRTATAFCDALRSPDPQQVRGMFVGPVRLKLQALAQDGRAIPYTSGDAEAGCGAGRAWYLGGSRMFAEVRTPSWSDRLDVWRGEWMGDRQLVSDVIYGRPVAVNGRRARTLSEALEALAAAPGRGPGAEV